MKGFFGFCKLFRPSNIPDSLNVSWSFYGLEKVTNGQICPLNAQKRSLKAQKCRGTFEPERSKAMERIVENVRVNAPKRKESL